MRTVKCDWREVNCPICGKRFIPAPEHVFRRTVNGKLRYICSYHCTMIYDKNKIDRRYARSAKPLQPAENNSSEGKGAG